MTTLVSDYNDLFANIYEDALRVARAQSVMTQLVTTYSDSMGTESRVFSQRDQASAASIAEGTDFASPSVMGKSELSTLIPGEVMAQAIISDRAVRQDPRVVQDAAFELGAALAQKIDQDLLSVFASLNGGAGVPLGSAGADLTWGTILAAQAQLNATNVPGRYNCVLHPYAAYDLTSSVNLVKDLASTPDSVKEGLAENMWLGRFQNIDFYVSNNIETDEGDAMGAIFSPEAIALDVRVAPRGLAPEYDASARKTEWNIYADYAFGVRRSGYGIAIVSDATAPTA